jgi:hypothetical protein
MPTTYGTSHFVSLEAAVRYYAAYEKNPKRAVELKLKEGSIHIGKPHVNAQQTLSVIADEGRYAITEATPGDRFTLNLWRDDMGTFTQPGCRDAEDALWHVNKAREHDGLAAITLDDLNEALSCPTDGSSRATLTPEP